MLLELIRVVVIPLLLMGAILGGLYLLLGRRLRAQHDPPGVRTFATFAVTSELLPFAQALCETIEAQVDVNPPESTPFGASFEVGSQQTAFVVQLGPARGIAGCLLTIEPIGGNYGTLVNGPGLRKLLATLHRGLEGLAVEGLRWHQRQDYNAGHEERGSVTPS